MLSNVAQALLPAASALMPTLPWAQVSRRVSTRQARVPAPPNP
jgi:hypothetical protein